MKIPFLSVAMPVLLLGGIERGWGQDSIAIPGTPKGDLPTELLQSRTYCRGIDWQLEAIEKRFPRLAVQVVAAKAAWQASPFWRAAAAIEADLFAKAGDEARSGLARADQQMKDTAMKLVEIKTEGDAIGYLYQVEQRAKGKIEPAMVRGNLLWNYPPYNEAPEKEFQAGFTDEITDVADGVAVTFQVPLSWKQEKSSTRGLMSFRNCYGHGNVWTTVLIQPTANREGRPISGQEAFDVYSEDYLRGEYARLGIELKSFLKTKVNGMPALLFTREQLYEQLGTRATRAAEVIRAFSGMKMISFQINTLGPEGAPTAATRIKKNEALFQLIGGSLRVEGK